MNTTKLFTELKQTDLYKGWVGEQKVVSTQSDKFGTIITIVEGEDGSYSILRFFKSMGTDKWNCSCDLQDVSAEKVMIHLLKRLQEEVR